MESVGKTDIFSTPPFGMSVASIFELAEEELWQMPLEQEIQAYEERREELGGGTTASLLSFMSVSLSVPSILLSWLHMRQCVGMAKEPI